MLLFLFLPFLPTCCVCGVVQVLYVNVRVATTSSSASEVYHVIINDEIDDVNLVNNNVNATCRARLPTQDGPLNILPCC